MTTYNGMDIHHYPNRTEIHINPPAFKNGQRVKLTEKGKRVQASRGHIFGLDDVYFVTNVVASVTVNMGRSEKESNIEGGRWHYGISFTMDDDGAGWGMSVEADEIKAIDHGGSFTLGVVMRDDAEAIGVLFGKDWIDCDYCGGHDPEGIGMASCMECDGTGTLDNGMSCHVCDGTGEVVCLYCNKETS